MARLGGALIAFQRNIVGFRSITYSQYFGTLKLIYYALVFFFCLELNPSIYSASSALKVGQMFEARPLGEQLAIVRVKGEIDIARLQNSLGPAR